jgi:transposase/IS5 family transposase
MHFIESDRNKNVLFPNQIKHMLPKNDLAPFIIDIVEKLDLSSILNLYTGKGNEAYHPAMMTALLFYSYATGVFSSRKIEKLTYYNLAYIYICCNHHPDHSTISAFRLRFFPQLSNLFFQILEVAAEYGLAKLGTVSLDGTKIEANASIHKANSFEHAKKTAEKLKAEVDELLKMAENADQIQLPDNFSLQDELDRRTDKIEKLNKAVEVIKRRHKTKREGEQQEYEEKLRERELKAQSTGRNPRGRPPAPPSDQPEPKSQYNYTDPDSRVMPDKRKGFVQGYNAQVTVDEKSRIIVGKHITQNTNDKRELEPALKEIDKLPKSLGRPEKLNADAGYFSEGNVNACQNAGIDPYIAAGREKHNQDPMSRFTEPPPLKPEATTKEKMQHKLRTRDGRKTYSMRKQTIEPIFGIIKSVIGFYKFSVRGLKKVSNEFSLVCTVYNIKRLHLINKNNILIR